MSAESERDYPQRVDKSILIQASPLAVWAALTEAHALEAWMSDEEFAVQTDWTPGGPVVFRGLLHGRLRFENRGVVQAFDPPRVLQYTHWSSLSRRVFPDLLEHHVVLRFELTPSDGATCVTLALSNLGNYAVYGHINYYWEIALPALRRYCEEATRA
ncbi:SRPBCC domain-containing protein [Lysobacter sp. 5GHs7-4]|uniref:SRPBCC family protein n=1 Tax=Lysobacter sp. 5GHs7-4 TaxID=2904253 RepID=UPI001E622621|nr:SRPBCC domain-containing protein [Lysobacter sp. 5GHs7-4]UHQ23233.1 SRPBCC domain-containing protein [Lysobacter sp. 5GHs7-4]